MKFSVNVKGDEEVRRVLRELGKQATPALVSSINRVTRDLKSRVVRKTTDIYNIRRRDLAPFVTSTTASRNNPNALLRLRIRAVPIEYFRPRVRMQSFTFVIRGRTVTRKLPAIYLRRYKGGAEKYVRPAFPLTQRTSGRLGSVPTILSDGSITKPLDKVRRRIGTARDRLTKIRYYTFPKQFVDETLLPDAAAFIPERMTVEIQNAFRRFNSKLGVRTLRNNVARSIG